MKYMGSKRLLAKELLPIILKNRTFNQWYVEPFVGGFNMIEHVKGNRIGNDVNLYLIRLFEALQKGWEPPKEVTEQEYKDIQKNKEKYPDYLVGYVGFNLSYGGKYFGGYRRDKEKKRNYAIEAYNNIIKQVPKIQGIKLYNYNYTEIPIPEKSLIYCDPPYCGATGYKDKFNHERFWEWARETVNNGHTVFISEYTAPPDFICVYQKKVNNSLEKNTGSKQGIERLFTLKSEMHQLNLFL